MATNTLALYWHLSSASKKERLDASVKLVGALERFQSQFTPKESSDTSEDEDENEGVEKSDGLDALNAQDVSYSIRRLVRGLASPRESSRLGFAVAFTELLLRMDTVTCAQVVALIVESSAVQGSMTGQEQRDVLFARLFGLTSVIQSGLLVRQTSLPTSPKLASDLAAFKETVGQLLGLGEKKSWLRESAWWTVGLAIDALQVSDAPWKEDAIAATIELAFTENKIWSPEKVALTLKLQALYPNRDWRGLLAPSFKNPDLLSAGNLNALARILKESSADEDDDKDILKAAAGSWRPQVHYVWDVILDQLCPGPNATAPPKGSFPEFFRVVVDESLFSSTSSPERKYWGFQIFQKALPRVSADDMPMLFTKNFMRSWINHLSNHDRYLHKVAKQVATEIQTFVLKNPTLGFTLILQLTGVYGSRSFDKLTRTKTVDSILSSMDAQGIDHYIDFLLKQVNDEEATAIDDAIQALNNKRAWIIEQLATLIRNGAIPKSDTWVQSVLDWLAVNGLFIVNKKSKKSPFRGLHVIPKPAFSEELRQTCRSRLLSCLADLTSQTTLVKLDDKSLKLPAVASDGQFWVTRVLATVEALEKDTEHVSILNELDEEELAIAAKARQLADRLSKIIGDQEEAAKGASLLLLATLLQLYCPEDEETDTDALEACIDGASRMFPEPVKKSKKSRKSTGAEAEVAEGETAPPEPIDVLVDAIIGFLEKSTAYMRTVGNQVFSHLSGEVKESTIELIISQLEKCEPQELIDIDDEDENMEEAGEGEDEDESEDEPSEAEEDSEDEEADLELRRKIEEALKVNGIDAASEDDESDDDLMDDDQMLAIDEQLAAVFRSQAHEKKSGKATDLQREATHFKNRVLDLVELFIKKQSSSSLIPLLLNPLIELIVLAGTDERQLSDKAKGLLRSRIGKLKDVPSTVDVENVTEVLNGLHERARKVHSSDMLAVFSQCSLYLSKLLISGGSEDTVVETYRVSLADFVTRKASALNTAFFQDFVRREPKTAWKFRNEFVSLADRPVNAYRQCQSFQILQGLVSQLPTMGDHTAEVATFMPTLRKALVEFLTKACVDTITLTTPQIKDLFKLSHLAIRQTKRVIPDVDDVAAIWEPTAWEGVREQLASAERFKAVVSLQTLCRQTEQLLAAEKPKGKKEKVTGKRKAEEAPTGDDGAAAPKTVKRKKVKKDKS